MIDHVPYLRVWIKCSTLLCLAVQKINMADQCTNCYDMSTKRCFVLIMYLYMKPTSWKVKFWNERSCGCVVHKGPWILRKLCENGLSSAHDTATNSHVVTICGNKANFVKMENRKCPWHSHVNYKAKYSCHKAKSVNNIKMPMTWPLRALFVAMSWHSQISLYGSTIFNRNPYNQTSFILYQIKMQQWFPKVVYLQ
jgi:hypothetical protein